MQRFSLLAISSYKMANSINSVDGATAGYEATLVGGNPDDLASCMNLKRLAKSAAAKTENAKMAALNEKLDGPQGENTRVFKTMKSAITEASRVMNYLVFLATLFAVCATAEAMPKATQLQNAVDLWGPATPEQLQCLKDSGYAKVIFCSASAHSTFITSAFDIHHGDGQLDKYVLENTRSAQKADLDVEYYMLPLIPSQKTGAEQFKVVYDGLASGGFTMKFLWIQENRRGGKGWTWCGNKYYFHRDQAENVALINDMVAAAKVLCFLWKLQSAEHCCNVTN
ncbi:unnamed protein product [Heligmosomoides polygyrus]|uniref:NAD(P)-bd_dom domain-containing protein n=1 Tax=Heligmosomoides polygyrus TaxID=6339 RepID=A0A183GFH5_HELPZ|nr:unnamed protein product [Heligmosomoides polygyrus]